MGQKSKKGCITAILSCSVIAFIIAVAVGIFFYRQAQTFKQNMTNPEPKTLNMLGLSEMPEGYHANFAMKIPFLAEMVMMSTKPGTFEDENHQQGDLFGEKGFLYVTFLRLKKDSTELQDFFEGKTDNNVVLKKNGVNIDVDELLKRGTFEAQNNKVFYLVQRGSIQAGNGRAEGLSTIMLIQCPKQEKMRMGIWYGPDNMVATSADESSEAEVDASLAGTVGDLDEVKSFIQQFSFCPE